MISTDVTVKGDRSITKHHQFTVGPSTSGKFLDIDRITSDYNRDPCMKLSSACLKVSAYMIVLGKSTEQYKPAVGLREIACTTFT